jgi:hypothetical protein
LSDLKKSSPLKPLGQMNWNLVGSIYGMSSLYKGPSKDASYQVSIHLAKRFQRRRFKKYRPIRNKNCLWRPCLSMDRDKMRHLYREPSIDASYQISVHLGKLFQRMSSIKIANFVPIR